ncbi:MAG: DUF1990 family protein [Nitriliruptorales bacterium]|nr:DUF1990 family protein [Nitriliruptorales bacterium]
MTDDDRTPRDAPYWADHTTELRVTDVADGGDPTPVEGRRIAGPLKGFGKMWQKTYRVRLEGADVTPEEVIDTWKERYEDFWPETATFFAPLAGVQPGEVALISDRQPGGLTLSTGVFVLYADERSFSFMTPEGHPFAGMITFSSHEDDDGITVAQIKALIRAQNPLVELTMAIYTHRKEDQVWFHVLNALAENFGVEGEPHKDVVCVDDKRQWEYFGNIRYDGVLHALLRPFRRP